jgi:hypothetical protein
MRTTLDLDDDVLDEARERARRERRSIGAVVSELARRGLRPADGDDELERRFPSFNVSPGARIIRAEEIKRALDDEW